MLPQKKKMNMMKKKENNDLILRILEKFYFYKSKISHYFKIYLYMYSNIYIIML